MNFEYRPRSHFDIESRVGQNREGPKVPKSDEETPCVTCSHPKTFHCKKFRRGEKPRNYLWVWNPQQPRFRAPAICAHYDPSNPLGVPLCGSTTCAVADCDCACFLSPYRKPRAPKKATTEKKPFAARKKRATKAQAQQQFDFAAPSFPGTSFP
jgi:hypothetical protein